MKKRIIGKVKRVSGPVVEVIGITDAMIYELVKVGESSLVGELIKLEKNCAVVQVYEDTTGIKPGDPVHGEGVQLSVELGPGLIGNIYDGIQRPLKDIYERCGIYIDRGVDVSPLNRDKLRHFSPSAETGDEVDAGSIIGKIKETENLDLKLIVPQGCKGRVVSVLPEGEYNIDETIYKVETEEGTVRSFTMSRKWPIRTPRPVKERLAFETPLITGQRVIDTMFPVARGGTVAIPGGFGTGKTMTQQAVAKWCDADIIVYIGCGERGNEMTDVLREFPELTDPRTGKSIMERTVLIANTSNMPVSAREASIYTGITIAEYFRDQGLDVAIMADSTSRWAEALRELSGRMEEMPAEEGFPAYLPTRIADFYERAGSMKTLSSETGSVTIIGAVSPPGGDFSEPVTQHTKRFIRCFWGLDRQLANARHYPAISWLTSYSGYIDDVAEWWERGVSETWRSDRHEILELLHKEEKLQKVVKLVGPDALPDSQRFILEVCRLFKNSFLQQNAFDRIDMFSTVEKQARMLKIILLFYKNGSDMLKTGATLMKIKRMDVFRDIQKMKFNIENKNTAAFDKLELKMEKSFNRMSRIYSD
ncbi:MAG: V-type ATP synthase subunit A [Chitinivibrionales bacterium]